MKDGTVSYIHFDAKYRLEDLNQFINKEESDAEINKEISEEKGESVMNTYALELNLEEAQDLLSHAGYYFPVPTVKEDVIFQYCFEDKEGPHTLDEVNETLCHFGFKAIGGRN